MSSSDGLHVAQEFYDQGGVDTRRRLHLHDVAVQFVVEGDPDAVRQMAELFATSVAEQAGVSEVVYTVSAR